MNEKSSRIIAILIIGFLLISISMVSGCIEQDKLKSPEEAQQAIVDVSNDVDSASGILEDIDSKLG